MTSLPPPLPPGVERTFHHTAATACVIATPLAFVFGAVARAPLGGLDTDTKAIAEMIVGLLVFLIIVVGIVAGIIALSGIPRHGAKGLLWKSLVGIILPVGIFALAIPAVANVRSRGVALQEKSVARLLDTAAEQINAKAGTMVDGWTRLDGGEVGSGRTLIYKYTLIMSTHEEISLEELTKAVRPEAVERYRTNPALEPLRKNRITIVHRYSDKNGELIGDIVIGPKDMPPETK